MRSHTGCICLTFLHCAFSSVPSNRLSERMHSCIGCICLTFLQCAFSNVSSNCLAERMHSHTGSNCMAFPRCVFSHASSNYLCEKIQSHTSSICLTFLHCLSLSLEPFHSSCFYLNRAAQVFHPWPAYQKLVSSLKQFWFQTENKSR